MTWIKDREGTTYINTCYLERIFLDEKPFFDGRERGSVYACNREGREYILYDAYYTDNPK